MGCPYFKPSESPVRFIDEYKLETKLGARPNSELDTESNVSRVDTHIDIIQKMVAQAPPVIIEGDEWEHAQACQEDA